MAVFPYFKVLRTRTKNRMIKKAKESRNMEMPVSFLGMLKHYSSHKVKMILLKEYFSVPKILIGRVRRFFYSNAS